MFQRTSESSPPIGEVLAVVRKISSRGESADEDAIWDGESWRRRERDGGFGEAMPKNHYYLWRRLET